MVSGSQSIAWDRCTTLTSGPARVDAVRLWGWSTRNPPENESETMDGIVQSRNPCVRDLFSYYIVVQLVISQSISHHFPFFQLMVLGGSNIDQSALVRG